MSTEAFRFRSDLEHAGYDIKGMSLIARDGDVGSVEGVVETTSGYVVLVSTGPFGFGKSRQLPAGLIAEIDQEEQVVKVDASAEQVKQAPTFDEDASAGVDLETELREHFEDAAAAPEPLEGITPDLPQRDDWDESVPQPLVAGPFATTEPEAPQRDDEAREEDMAGTPPTAPYSLSTGDVGTSAPTDADAPTPADESTPSETDAASAIDSPEASRAAIAPSEAPSETKSAEASEPAAPRRFDRSSRTSEQDDTKARASRSSQRKSSSGTQKRDGRGSTPIARYDSLSAGEILPKLRELSQSELTQVERYERKHENRKTLLERIEALRGDQPWRGYDNQKVADVKKKLAKAEPDTARFVRDYERKHKDRSGVLQAARRRLDDA